MFFSLNLFDESELLPVLEKQSLGATASKGAHLYIAYPGKF